MDDKLKTKYASLKLSLARREALKVKHSENAIKIFSFAQLIYFYSLLLLSLRFVISTLTNTFQFN